MCAAEWSGNGVLDGIGFRWGELERRLTFVGGGVVARVREVVVARDVGAGAGGWPSVVGVGRVLKRDLGRLVGAGCALGCEGLVAVADGAGVRSSLRWSATGN